MISDQGIIGLVVFAEVCHGDQDAVVSVEDVLVCRLFGFFTCIGILGAGEPVCIGCIVEIRKAVVQEVLADVLEAILPDKQRVADVEIIIGCLAIGAVYGVGRGDVALQPVPVAVSSRIASFVV